VNASATSHTAPALTATPAGEAPVATLDGIVDIIWLWQNQKDSAGKTVIEVPNPESYRL
jgi:hypothetical protein